MSEFSIYIFFFLICFSSYVVKAAHEVAYVGEYTTMGNDAAVTALTISADGQITNFTTVSNTPPDVSWIIQHPTMDIVYALSESGNTVSAFLVHTYTWKLINEVQTGKGPVYLSMDDSGKFLFVAQYNAGKLSVYSIQDDGSIGKMVDDHDQGFGTHSAVPNLKNEKFIYSPVLGLDKVDQWVLSDTGKLTPNPSGASIQLPPGFGPRHMVFHPSIPLAFIADEGNQTTPSRLTVCKYDSKTGALSYIDSHSTISKSVDPVDMYPAEILISESGEFIYISNRDASTKKRDSIATFQLTGHTLTMLGEAATGWYPRSMSLSADGTILLVGNQKDSSVITFKVDKATGKLTRTTSSKTFSNNVAFVGFMRV